MKTTPAWECSCSAGLLRLFLKLSFQPQSAIRARPLHVLRMGGRDAILLPGDGPGAPGASSGAAGRHPQARLIPAAICQQPGAALPAYHLPQQGSSGSDKVLQTEVLPADKEMKSPQSLLSKASSPVAPAQAMLSELRGANSPQAELGGCCPWPIPHSPPPSL